MTAPLWKKLPASRSGALEHCDRLGEAGGLRRELSVYLRASGGLRVPLRSQVGALKATRTNCSGFVVVTLVAVNVQGTCSSEGESHDEFCLIPDGRSECRAACLTSSACNESLAPFAGGACGSPRLPRPRCRKERPQSTIGVGETTVPARGTAPGHEQQICISPKPETPR
jgi:hypothetical protein